MQWLEHVKQRGWHQTALTVLDIIEPIAPLVGQWLWVMQPIAHVFGGRTAVHDLAQLLEETGGVDHLRSLLVAPPHADSTHFDHTHEAP